MPPLFECPVTPERRREIHSRWVAIDKELSDLASRKPVIALLSEREIRLHKEQLALEYELSYDDLKRALARLKVGLIP
jgi:hypothetical protein